MPSFKGLKETQNAVNLGFFPSEFITDSNCFFSIQLASKILNALFPEMEKNKIKLRNIYFVLN